MKIKGPEGKQVSLKANKIVVSVSDFEGMTPRLETTSISIQKK